jgi:hypothetical protein
MRNGATADGVPGARWRHTLVYHVLPIVGGAIIAVIAAVIMRYVP